MITRDTRRAPSVVVDTAMAIIYEAIRDMDGVAERLSGGASLNCKPKKGESVHVTVPIYDGEFRAVLVSTAIAPFDGTPFAESNVNTAQIWYRFIEGDEPIRRLRSSRMRIHNKHLRQLSAKIINIAIRSR
jgi:hypothetical protein